MEKEMEMLDRIIVEIPHQTPPIAYYADDELLIHIAWDCYYDQMSELESENLGGVDQAIEAMLNGHDLSSMDIIENEEDLDKFLSQTTGHQIIKAQRAVSKLLRTGCGY